LSAGGLPTFRVPRARLPFGSMCSSGSACGTCSYYRCRISCYGDGRRMHNIFPSLATGSSFRGQSYQDLGDLTSTLGPPEGQVPHLAGLPRSMLDRREIGTKGAPTPIHAANSTRQKRPWNTFWLAAHSPGRCGMRCYHGSDPQRDRRGGEMTSWDGGMELRNLPPYFTQGDFIVDHAHGGVDLEAS
jgi:hypothetical protein